MEALPQLGFKEAVLNVLKYNYANFNGRARRSEFWFFYLAEYLYSMVIELVLMGIMVALVSTGHKNLDIIIPILFALMAVLMIPVIIPYIAVTVRRFHDIGKSGWNYLLALIPIAGPIMILVMLCQDSDRMANEYGPSPKYR